MAVPVRRYLLVGQQLSLLADLRFAFQRRCPFCRQGRLFRPWSVTIVDSCTSCGAPLGRHDVGDGAAVLLIFIFGFSIIPLALVLEYFIGPPLWVHIIIWGAVLLGLALAALPAAKAYIMLLNRRHRGEE
jgi:uncharacterized protein (DUF983 family)